MKLLHKLLVVALFGAMVVPGLEAPRTKGAGQKHGCTKGKGAWKDMTPEQRAAKRAENKAKRDAKYAAMSDEDKAKADAKKAERKANAAANRVTRKAQKKEQANS